MRKNVLPANIGMDFGENIGFKWSLGLWSFHPRNKLKNPNMPFAVLTIPELAV